MDDTGAGRDDGETLEGVGAPLEEGETLGVTLHLELQVLVEGVVAAILVDLDGVINDEIDGHKRVDLVGVAAETLAGVPHGSQIDHGGHASEILNAS